MDERGYGDDDDSITTRLDTNALLNGETRLFNVNGQRYYFTEETFMSVRIPFKPRRLPLYTAEKRTTPLPKLLDCFKVSTADDVSNRIQFISFTSTMTNGIVSIKLENECDGSSIIRGFCYIDPDTSYERHFACSHEDTDSRMPDFYNIYQLVEKRIQEWQDSVRLTDIELYPHMTPYLVEERKTNPNAGCSHNLNSIAVQHVKYYDCFATITMWLENDGRNRWLLGAFWTDWLTSEDHTLYSKDDEHTDDRRQYRTEVSYLMHLVLRDRHEAEILAHNEKCGPKDMELV